MKSFYIEKRHFFFLLDENKISGLISESNLNSRQVKVWLFSLVSELEIGLSNLVMNYFQDEESLKQNVFARNDGNSKDSKKRFQEDLEKGTELNFVEYLYLSTLIDLIKEENLFSQLGYKNIETFENEYKEIKHLRNKIMHSSSIITKENSVRELWIIIDKIEESLFILR